MSIAEMLMNTALRLCDTLDTAGLSRVAVEYARRKQNAGQEAIMDVISMSLAKRLPYDEFRKVMIEVNKAIDERGKIFHKGDTKQGEQK